MIKSTASAGQVELQSSPSAYYLWEFPEKPVSVRISLDVVDRLERDVMESFRAITARGSEVGGLLLGRSEAGPTVKTIIENYELFHCDYSRGPLYLLSDEEKTRLEEVIRRKKSGQTGSVVGFFRSNTRKSLALDEEDLDIFREYFSRPEQAFLLVKPFAAKASVAGIFIWEDKKVRSEGSYIEFPFRRSELGKGDFAKSIVADEPRQQESAPEPPAPAAPAAHKTGSRAPVLPFSLKREEESPVAAPPLRKEERAPVVALTQKSEAAAPAVVDPAAAPKAAPAPVKLVEKPRAESPAARNIEKKSVPAAPPVRDEKPEVKQEEKPEEKKAELKKESKQAESKKEEKESAQKESPATAKPEPKEPAVAAVVEDEIKPALRFESLHESSPFGGKKLFALFGGLAMLAAAGWTLYYLKFKSPEPAQSAIAARLTSGFQLKVERSNGQLLVSWNRESDLVRTAQSAVLSISDGGKTEDVTLDLTQLHAGSILYSPLSPNVNFRLEVKDRKKGNSRSESVQAPSEDVPTSANPKDTGKPAPPAGAQAQAAGTAEPPHEKATPAEASRADANAATEAAQPPRPTGAPPKPFSLAARIRQPESTDLPEAPSVDASATTSALRPAIPGRLPAPPTPSAPPPQQTTASAQPAQSALPSNGRVGGKAQEPKLLRRVDAVFPPMARQARVGGVVRLQASVGKDGKVNKIVVLSGPPLLRQAAIDALQKWVYSPAILNGSPIDATTDVDVNFNLTGR